MRIKVQDERPLEVPGAGNSDSVLEKARESVIKAEKAREQARNDAIKAREAAARSAQVTWELFREAKRKARAVQITAAKARMEAKIANRMLKQAGATGRKASRAEVTGKKAKENDLLNTIAEQVKANLAKGPQANPETSVNQEIPVKKEGIRKVTGEAGAVNNAPNEAREIEWLSSGLFEGRADLLIQSAKAQQIYNLADLLGSVQNLKVEFVSGSEDGGSSIAIMAEQPVPLLDILGRIPAVDAVTQFGWRKIELTLKKE